MSDFKDVIYITEKASHGGSLEARIAHEFDINAGPSVKLFRLRGGDDLKGYSIISVQAVWTGLTGVLDGTIDFVQSHDGINFDDIGVSHTLSSAAGSVTLERLNFGSKFAGVNLTKIGITGGTITIIFIAKRK